MGNLDSLKFLFPAAGLAAGIFFGRLFFPAFTYGFVVIGVSLLVWLIIHIKSKNPVDGLHVKKFHFLWIFLMFTGIGIIDYELKGAPFLQTEIDGKQCNITGRIEEVTYLTEGDRFKVKINSIKDENGQEITCRNINCQLITNGFSGHKGDILYFETKPFKLSEDNAYSRSLLNQGIEYTVKVKDENIEVKGSQSSVFTFFDNKRTDLEILIEKSSLKRTTSEFLVSLLLGDKSLLASDVKQTLSSVGLAHILALSGMHVAIVFSLFYAILFPLSLMGYSRTRRIAALLLIWAYVLFTGASPSTVRAAFMATMVVAAILLERKNSALNALLAAIFIILLISPLSLWNIGLQLSFLCVASLILFTDKLNPVQRHLHPKLYNLVNIILITLITTFTTWTMVGYYFGKVPALFLPANILLLPLLPIFIGTGMIYIGLLRLGHDSNLLAKFLDLFNDLLLGTAEFLRFKPESVLEVSISTMVVILWLLAVFLFGMVIYSISRKKKYLLLGSALFVFLVATGIYLNQETDKKDTLKFVNHIAKIETHFKDARGITKLNFPKNNISRAELENFRIIVVDSPILSESLTNFCQKEDDKKNYLIVGNHSDMSQIAEIISSKNISKIILHAGVDQKKKEEFLVSIPEQEWEKIYSLKESGSVEFEL